MDTEDIIWLIFMIIAGIFSITGNARKKKAAPKKQETARPPIAPAEVFDSMPHKTVTYTTSTPNPKRKKRAATAKPMPQAEAKPRPTASNPTPDAPISGEIGASETEVSSASRPEFDLREAVIYSEILRPKFDE